MTERQHFGAGLTSLSRRQMLGSGMAASLLAAAGVASAREPTGTLRIAADRETAGRLLAPGSVWDCLTRVGPEGALEGELADRWEAAAGGREWTFSLRPGARWHDGQSLTADAVAAALTRHLGAGGPLDGVTAVRAARGAVRLTLALPDRGLPFRLSDADLAIRDPARPDIGTGLYRIVQRRERDVRLALSGEAGAGFRAVDLLLLDRADDRAAALRSGRVDAISGVDPATTLPRGARMTLAAGGAHLRIRARGPDAGPLAAALKSGIDRAAVLALCGAGHGTVAADHPLAGQNAPRPDPDRARHALATLDARPVTIALDRSALGHPGAGRVLREIARVLALRGLALRPAAAHRSAHGADFTADLTVEIGRGRATDDMALAAFPLDGLTDPAGFRQRLRAARGGDDAGHRAALARMLAREGHTVVPAFLPAVFAHGRLLAPPAQIGGLDTLDSARIAERWRFAPGTQIG